jgi:Putative prokaryotic signal transducing protein
MKWIFSSRDVSQLSRFKTMMGQADIPCVVRNAQLDLPMPLVTLETELWVVNDVDCPKASDLIRAWSP